MQDFPNKPIRLVTFKSGNGSEVVIRLIAKGLESLGQQVIVDHQTPGITPIELVARAPADGHTLLVCLQLLWTGPLLQNMPYDAFRDFSPITLATTSPLLVVVNPSLEANSLEELIALAKAKPGSLKYRSGFNGSCSQFAGALFSHMAGVNIVCVPSNSGGLVGVKDLIAGNVHLMIPSAGAIMPFVKSGQLRALAVTSARPSTLAPSLPTVAATLPGYEAAQAIGLFAPANTPLTVIARLNQIIVQFLKTAEVKETLLNAGLEVVGSSPEELATEMKFEITKWGKLIKDLGIRSN